MIINGSQLNLLRTEKSIFDNSTKQDTEKKEETAKTQEKDSVTISEEGMSFLETREESKKEQNQLNEEVYQSAIQDVKDQMKEIQEQSEARAEEYRILLKCMKIAMNVAAGNKVPEKDQQYLRDNNPDLFAQAMKVRVPKEDPEECESVIDEDEKDGKGTDSEKKVSSTTESDGITISEKSQSPLAGSKVTIG